MPIISVVMLVLALGGNLLRPFLGYMLAYLGLLAVLASLAVQELRKGERVG